MAWVALLLAVFFNIVANVSFKLAMVNAGSQQGEGLIKLLTNPWLWSGGVSSVLLLISYLAAISGIGLGVSYAVVTSLALVIITVVSSFLFGEQFTVARGLGVLLVIAGISILVHSEYQA